MCQRKGKYVGEKYVLAGMAGAPPHHSSGGGRDRDGRALASQLLVLVGDG